MKEKLTYQDVILRDVQREDYGRLVRRAKLALIAISLVTLTGYLTFLYLKLFPFFGRMGSLVTAYMYENYRESFIVLYFHEAFLYIFGVPLILLCLGFSAFMFFDIQQRNAIIRRLLEDSKK